MSQFDAEKILDAVEANYWAQLYEARHSEQTAAKIIPQLIGLLAASDRATLVRTLAALAKIGSSASEAGARIIPHLRSPDSAVAHNAVAALAAVSWKQPEQAIDPLVSVADAPGLRKIVMQGLIWLRAKRAADVFVRAFDDPSATMRKLALRGLAEIGADPKVTSPVLARAAKDRSERVREYAARKFSGISSAGSGQ